ncbi:hypothetical protein K488DRAFT_87733 [Vararia minispora EC-137]|uniref:Uncharacterized protein n=1 Tax=Vararia minispora EC-137 TaxID=1314806 RepID=A0ACB8QFS6_9AGAM|nr:hypothetical protein K488DRAFT_87733 [Vararia minispora EC-137]
MSFFLFDADAPPHDSSPFPSSARLRAKIRAIGYSPLTVLLRVASEIDLSTITVLSVRGGGENSSEDTEWADIFAVLAGVRTLYLLDMTGKPDVSIFRALGKHIGDPPSLLLPCLDYIWLATDAVSTVHSAYRLPAEELVGMLTSRAKLSTSIVRSPRSLRVEANVALENPDGGTPVLLQLNVLVSTIRWKD